MTNPTRIPKRDPPLCRSPNGLTIKSGCYHWDMLKNRPTCADIIKRKRLGTLQSLSTRKAKPISLCHRQTSRPPSMKSRRNQRPESAQVPAPDAPPPFYCTTLIYPREKFKSPTNGARKFRIRERPSAQQKNRNYSYDAPLLGAWT